MKLAILLCLLAGSAFAQSWSTAKGFDFRSTLAFVTDPANTQFVGGTFPAYVYPATTTIGGDSVTWGWMNGGTLGGHTCDLPSLHDNSAAVDARLAGTNQSLNGQFDCFEIDLPATGSYTIRLANGDQANANTQNMVLYDGTTAISPPISSSTAQSANQYIDATGVLRTSDTDWVTNNATLTHTFTTSILRVLIGTATPFTPSTIAYIQVTQGGGGGGTITAITAVNPRSDVEWACTGSNPTYSCTVHERQHGWEIYPLKVTTSGTFGSTSTTNTGISAMLYAWCQNGHGATGCGSLTSGTYTSGIIATGTVGQTCALTAFNVGSGATATVALTGTNTIAGGTALVITNPGGGMTSPPNSATAGNGTATCSGTASVSTVMNHSDVTSGSINPELYPYFDGTTDDAYGPTTIGGGTCASGGTPSGSAPNLICTYTGTISFTGGFSITINLVINSYVPPTISYGSTGVGSCTGCANSDAHFPDPDTVTFTNPVPAGSCPGTNCASGTVGGTYTDANLHGVVSTVMLPVVGSNAGTIPGLQEPQDAIETSWNADGTMKTIAYDNGTMDIVLGTSPFTVLWHGLPGGIASNAGRWWSSIDPRAIYYIPSGALGTIHKAVLNITPGGANTCDNLIYTAPAGAVLGNGGDGDLSVDDWTAQIDTPHTTIYAINLNGPQCTPYTATAYGISTSGIITSGYRSIEVTAPHIVTGKRYITLATATNTERFSLPAAGGTVTYDGPFSAIAGYHTATTVYDTAGACTSSIHEVAGFCESPGHANSCNIGGIQGYCNSFLSRYTANYTWLSFQDYAVPVGDMQKDVLAGGGSTMIIIMNRNNHDIHYGGARKGGVIALSGDYAGQASVTSWKIVNVTNNAGVCHITSDTGYTGVNTDVLNIGNLGGACTALNGTNTCTVANLSGTAFDCSGSTFSGSYTTGTGVFYKNAAISAPPFGPLGPHFQEIDAVYMPSLNVASMNFRRILANRAVPSTDNYREGSNYPTPGIYLSQAHATIAQDGSKISWQANNSLPDQTGIYTTLTGFISPGVGRGAIMAGSAVSAGSVQ